MQAEKLGSMQNLILLPFEALEGTTSLGGSTGPDLTRYFLVCTVLVVLTIAVAWGMRKLVGGNLKSRAAQRSLHVVDVLPLGGRRKLAVVRCYDRTFVLGLGEKEVSAIAELDAVIASDEQPSEPLKSDQVSFAAALEQIRKVMPDKALPTAQVQAGDVVAPALSRKIVRRKVQATKPAETPATKPKPAHVQPQPASPAPERKLVRRKVAPKRNEAAVLAHEEKARAVASAAMEIAKEMKREQKRKLAHVQQPTVVAAKPPAPVKSTQVEHRLRLDGILG
ncbi:MAG: flagellar biogenesis protein FliO [Candidatus Paceibacteria bacterium]|jgi:flagellar biogenesis protein FliO